MIDTLRSVLDRAEIHGGDVFNRHCVRSWSTGILEGLIAANVLRSIVQASDLIYRGCDHDCVITRDFQPHPHDESRVVCVHRCGLGCGLVVLDPPEFDRWQFSLLGLAGAVRHAVDAKGQVVEDVRDRLVSVGIVGDSGRTAEVFLARGLHWPDAATVLKSAKRLHASQHPLVLTLAAFAPAAIWPKMKPACRVLREHLAPASGKRLLALDLSPLLSLESIPHPESESPHWLTNKSAAIKLQDIVDGLTFNKAKARVSVACAQGTKFRTNGQVGSDLRIEAHSFSTWLLTQREKNLAEDNESTGIIEVPRRAAPKRSSSTSLRQRAV